MKALRITRSTYFCGHRRGVFFRIAGYGLSIDLHRPPLFSERNGFKRVLRFGPIALEFLRR